jgi:hypothetical protein
MRIFITTVLFVFSISCAGEPNLLASNEFKASANSEALKTTRLPAPASTNLSASPEQSSVKVHHVEKDNAASPYSAENIVAWATVALAFITAALAWATYRLYTTTVKLANDAKKTSERQAKETLRTLAIAESSASVARDEFYAAHRPKLIIRNVAINPVNESPEPERISIDWTIANIGDTPATIIAESTRYWKEEDGNIFHKFRANQIYKPEVTRNIQIESGESRLTPIEEANAVYDFYFSEGAANSSNNAGVPQNGGLIFIGYIIYVDQLGKRRKTAFMRRYDFGTRRFTKVDDSDYEYQD